MNNINNVRHKKNNECVINIASIASHSNFTELSSQQRETFNFIYVSSSRNIEVTKPTILNFVKQRKNNTVTKKFSLIETKKYFNNGNSHC